MLNEIIIRYEIPIIADGIVDTPAMIFKRWMPSQEDDFIVINDENATIKFWHDKSCLGHVLTVKNMSNHLNILVNKIFADVVLRNVSNELCEYILKNNKTNNVGLELQDEYIKLGETTYMLALKYLNRLIAFVKSQYGQYWLREYPIDINNIYSSNVHFKARVKIASSSWVRWNPPNTMVIKATLLEEMRFITKEKWLDAKVFIGSARSTSLVWELLAGAEWLAGIGHHRSALTEAVTALEVAISEFSRQSNTNAKFSTLISKRIDLNSLTKWIERVGFSATLYYLLPLLFSEEQMPKSLLIDCQEALTERQNVVHNGQRDVSKIKLTAYLSSIRKVCNLLKVYSQENTNYS